MNNKKINIVENDKSGSIQIKKNLKHKLINAGFNVPDKFEIDAELLICIGGDGSLLSALSEYDFPDMPIVGINTGHLGFFQELDRNDIDEFIFKLQKGEYIEHEYTPVEAEIVTEDRVAHVRALNEIIIKGAYSHAAHLNIFIGKSFVEKFIGDGIVVSTAAGSTAYNYALGGSIIDPRLNILQVTPIAAINSTAYRSFTSSILLPPNLKINVFPDYPRTKEIIIAYDGLQEEFKSIKEVHVGLAARNVKLLRFKEYDFWSTVKKKLL